MTKADDFCCDWRFKDLFLFFLQMHKHGKGRSSSVYSNKSSLSAGSRYREGHVISTSPIPGSPEVVKIYLFEGLISK